MAVTKLTKAGEEFIRSKCNGSGNSKLRGSAADKKGYSDNPTAVLPYCSPLTTTSKIWLSNPDINSGIRTNDELGEALIKLYNKYAEIYQMDANIMAAQAYQESAYIVWNYAVNSTASGISQFTAGTIYGIVIVDKYNEFTDNERKAITKNTIDYTFESGKTPPKNKFVVQFSTGKKNRAILHQNIIDNPEIMIKAQFVYMKKISTKCNGLASCTLFGYSRGPGYVKSSSYSDAIAAAKGAGNSYENEGIIYVYRIFKNLYDNFGYKHLDITKEAAEKFDKFNATLG